MRAFGWPAKAPEGYVNKEHKISSNKYQRWVETIHQHCKAVNEVKDMMISDQYTLVDLCEELTKQGHARCNGTCRFGKNINRYSQEKCKHVMQKLFRNPFYGGWVSSKHFGIRFEETWE